MLYGDRVHCVVTGVGGFIGSHLAERLVRRGDTVLGIDCFMPYYPRPIKERNLAWLRDQPTFTFFENDLRSDSLDTLLEDAEVVFHLAAMPGLAASWSDFELYMTC